MAAFQEPQVCARNVVQKVENSPDRIFSFTGSPLQFSKLPITPIRMPPILGEHTGQFLKEELGFDTLTIAQLKKDRVI